jgi:hypothetical protein
MAKDSRRLALSSLRTARPGRGRFRQSKANVNESCGCTFTSNEIAVEKQYGPSEEVIRAAHYSHSGRLARVYRWKQ